MTSPRPCQYPRCPRIINEGRFCSEHAGKTRHACAWAGCSVLLPPGEKYCLPHKEAAERQYDQERGHAHKRGYDKVWARLRQKQLAEFPLCHECQKLGRTTAATMVHHVVPIREGGRRLDQANLESLCRPCHERMHPEKRTRNGTPGR